MYICRRGYCRCQESQLLQMPGVPAELPASWGPPCVPCHAAAVAAKLGQNAGHFRNGTCSRSFTEHVPPWQIQYGCPVVQHLHSHALIRASTAHAPVKCGLLSDLVSVRLKLSTMYAYAYKILNVSCQVLHLPIQHVTPDTVILRDWRARLARSIARHSRWMSIHLQAEADVPVALTQALWLQN